MKKSFFIKILFLHLLWAGQLWGQCTTTVTVNNILCNGGTGSATASVTGGTAPYSYFWSNGEITQTITGLTAGSYTVNTQDSQCTASGTELVTNGDFSAGDVGFSSGYSPCNWPNCLSPEGWYAIGPNPAAFNGSWVGVDHTTGTGNFMIVNGASSAGANVWCQTIAVTPNTNYLFSTWVSSMNAGSPALLQFSINGMPLGSIFSAPPSANIWLQFASSWNSGSNTSITICIVNQNTTANGNDFGLDDISFQQCTTCASSAIITITEPAVLVSSVTPSSLNCTGIGSASASAGGGTAPYSYLWSNGQTSSVATALSTGSYTITVFDANGCIASSPTYVTAVIGPTVSISANNILCNGGAGDATANITGGTAPYTYAWSSGETTQIITGLATGTYTVDIHDSQCTPSGTELVGNGDFSSGNTGFSSGYSYCNWPSCLVPEGNYAIGTNPASFNGTWVGVDHTSGTGNFMVVNGAQTAGANVWCQTVTVTPNTNYLFSTWVSSMNSGSPALLQFSINGMPLGSIFSAPPSANIWLQFFAAWNSGANTSITICIVNQNTTASGNDFGLDDISFQECNYCPSTATVTITEPQVLATTIASNNVSCFGGTNGGATTTATGGTSPYTYLWNNNLTTQNATGLILGSYSVNITDNNGCSNTQSVLITEPALLTSSVTSTNPNCSTGTGTAAVNASGGTASYTYLWSITPLQSTQTVTGLTTGTYSISVVDTNGCATPVQVVSIIQPPPIVLTSSITPTICSTNTGTALVNASGGTGSFTYQWDASAGGQMTQIATGLGTGTYAVAVTDSNGCMQIQTIIVISNNPLIVSTTFTQTDCVINNGTATANPSNGTAPYTYSWSNGQTSQIVSGLAVGMYSVTVTDTNGCVQTQTVSVTQIAGPTANATATLVNITLGGNTQLNATGGGSYQWVPATGLSCTTCSDPVAVPSSTTEYCVFVKDTNGCVDSACITINVDIPCGAFYIPNAFSPNGDGEDDDFQIYIGRPDCILSFLIKIYNRWGEKIYETSDPSFKWNGIYNKGTLKDDQPVGTAVFVYYMNIEFSDGSKSERKGNISLLR